jgi:hypothetical protein
MLKYTGPDIGILLFAMDRVGIVRNSEINGMNGDFWYVWYRF